MSALVVKRSASGFAETTRSLVEAIERRQLTLFARVDHAAAAREAGLELEAEEVFLFGSGTPLMQRDRRIGIELPLRILVWREGADVQLAYRDPARAERRLRRRSARLHAGTDGGAARRACGRGDPRAGRLAFRSRLGHRDRTQKIAGSSPASSIRRICCKATKLPANSAASLSCRWAGPSRSPRR